MQFKMIFYSPLWCIFARFVYAGKKVSAEGRSPKAEGGQVGRSPKKSPPAVRREPQPQSESIAFGLETYKVILRKKKPKKCKTSHTHTLARPCKGKAKASTGIELWPLTAFSP